MILFERIQNKIKDDLIIEMNNTGSDDPWDDKDTKTENKKKPNQNKKFNNKFEFIIIVFLTFFFIQTFFKKFLRYEERFVFVEKLSKIF